MKVFIFLTIFGLVATEKFNPKCYRRCNIRFEPYCACKTSGKCTEFYNKCYYYEYGCSSPVYVTVNKGECPGDEDSFPITSKCARNCQPVWSPVCGCKSDSFENCRQFRNHCEFDMFNCSTKDYVKLHDAPCPKNR